jgi:hypothetical protein
MKAELTKEHIFEIGGYNHWIKDAPAGEKVIYARGYLPVPKTTDEISRIVARHMLEAYGRGEVELTQRRLEDFNYEYIATKRRKIRVPVSFILPPLEPAPVLEAA